jgi:hypothetical protein
MRLIRPALTTACLVLAAAAATACSDDDRPATPEGAEDTVRDYLKAFGDRDYDDACDYWTDDYRDRTIEEWNSDFGGDDPVDSCEDMLRQGVMLAGAFGEELDLSVDSISSEETGEDEVLVTVVYKDEDSDDGEFVMVREDGGWLVNDELDDDEADEDDASPEPSEETSEPPAEPSAIGTPATLGSWTVTVSDVDLDAGPELGKGNLYNSAARDQYLLVTYSATYNGTERTADVMWDLEWSLTGTDSVVREPSLATTPAENQGKPTEVRTGGTIEWQVPFDVDPTVVEGGLLTVSTWTGEEDVYVDFQL